MTTLGNTLTGRLLHAVPSRRTRAALGVVSFAVLTAVGARLAIPLPVTPVPFTFQVLFVLLAGAMLGPRLGALSQLLYLSAGAAGLPVFAAGGGILYLLGPTGGYLLAFPFAAYLTGALVAPSLARTVLALLAGLAAIYAGGVAWLAGWGSLDAAVVLGLQPFVIADLVKLGLALLVIWRWRDSSQRLFTS